MLLFMNYVPVTDSSVSPKSGDFGAVKLAEKLEAIVCQYKKSSYTLP